MCTLHGSCASTLCPWHRSGVVHTCGLHGACLPLKLQAQMEFSLLEAQLGQPEGTIPLPSPLSNCHIRSPKDIAKTREGSARNGTRVSIKARISSWVCATITADGLHPWVLLYTQGRHTLYPSPGKSFFQSRYWQRKFIF